MKLEADELCTSMIAHPPGSSERFAIVMGNDESDTRFYFFVTREEGHAIARDIIEMVGYDA